MPFYTNSNQTQGIEYELTETGLTINSHWVRETVYSEWQALGRGTSPLSFISQEDLEQFAQDFSKRHSWSRELPAAVTYHLNDSESVRYNPQTNEPFCCLFSNNTSDISLFLLKDRQSKDAFRNSHSLALPSPQPEPRQPEQLPQPILPQPQSATNYHFLLQASAILSSILSAACLMLYLLAWAGVIVFSPELMIALPVFGAIGVLTSCGLFRAAGKQPGESPPASPQPI